MTGNGTDSIAALCKKRRTPPDMNYVNYVLKQRNYSTRTILPTGEKLPVRVVKDDGNELHIQDEIPEPIRNWALELCKKAWLHHYWYRCTNSK